MPEERLQKILAQAGMGSRRACEEIVAAGRVTVDGRVVTELGAKADPSVAQIRVDGELVRTERRRYIMLHKPAGYLSNPDLPRRGRGTPRVAHPSWRDLVSVPERLFPVGRLDLDSEGLLLLTNDGQLAQQLTHPSFEHPKVYLVCVRGIPDARKIRRLEHGIMLEDGPTAPAEATLLRELPREWAFLAAENRSLPATDDAETRGTSPRLRASQSPRRLWRTTWLRVTLREGRKRQVRRMVGRLGHPALRVIRVGLGELALGSLPRGQWRELTSNEIGVLQQMASLSGPPSRQPQETSGRGTPRRRAPKGSPNEAGRPSAAKEVPAARMAVPIPHQGREETAISPPMARDSAHENHAPSTIAIDGPSASGKSTIGRLLAREMGYLYFDTGVMYRAIACLALGRRIPINDEAAITALAGQVFLEIMPATVDDGRDVTVLADGVDITMKLRRPEVERAVSPVSAYPGVRDVLKVQQRRIGQGGHVVMVGRDIGTVVLPDADLKIYLDATLKERAHRRYLERLARGENPSPEEVLADMKRRDQIDSSREHAPLMAAPDAVIVDTTGLTVEQVMERVGSLVENLGRRSSPRQGRGSPRSGRGDLGRAGRPVSRTPPTPPAGKS